MKRLIAMMMLAVCATRLDASWYFSLISGLFIRVNLRYSFDAAV